MQLFQGLITVQYSTVNNYVSQNGTKNLAEYLYDLECKQKSFNGYKVQPIDQNFPRYSKENIVKNINNLLNKGEIVGFGYNYGVLNQDDKSGGHGSLIVGRRLNPNSGDCEYLVRNSWGKDCQQNEGIGLSCHKNCDGDGNNCRFSGHFWVSEARLKEAMLGITYLP